MNTKKWIKYIGDRNIKSVEDATEYIRAKILPQLKSHGYSVYTIIRKKDYVKMGICGLYDREGLEGIDIGFAILPEFEKQGYVFEAVHKLKQIAFEEFKIQVLNAITVVENKSSQKLLQKLGMTLKGKTILPDDDEELLLYQLKINKPKSLSRNKNAN